MLCELCGKIEATVHLTEIINGKISKLHLCEECARKKSEEMEQHFGLAELLAGLADFGVQVQPELAGGPKCPNCKFRYQDFKRIGRLGCAECYETFSKNLAPLLKRIHGADQHLGKAPLTAKKGVKVRDEIQELKSKLQKAIQLEEFEEAARLRDRIKELEKDLEKKRSSSR